MLEGDCQGPSDFNLVGSLILQGFTPIRLTTLFPDRFTVGAQCDGVAAIVKTQQETFDASPAGVKKLDGDGVPLH